MRHAAAFIIAAISLVPVAALPQPAAAQRIEMGPPSAAGGPEIAGEAVATNRQQWPATYVFETAGQRCTATAVGPRVVLTAAHCVVDWTEADLRVPHPVTGLERVVGLRCTTHPAWPGEASSRHAAKWADYALCLTDRAMARPGRGFETIEADATRLGPGLAVTLLGYGCREAGQASVFRALYQGPAAIADLPQGQAAPGRLIRAVGRASICFGDSGGGAYAMVAADRRRLIALNSRGDAREESYLASTSDTEFLDWARRWAEEAAQAAGSGIVICGVVGAAGDCRS